MSEMNPLDQVVEDAVNDSVADYSSVEEPSTETTVADPAASEPIVEASIDPTTATPEDPEAAVQDEFEKRWGIPARGVTGRENRIPHSRVKQMVSKAEKEAIDRITKELEGKWTEERTPIETKIKDYETRLEKVAQFEQVLENDPRTFLNLLSQIPAYKEFFDFVKQAAKQQQAPQAETSAVPEGMPQPDQALPDGTKVYSMEGLQALLKWQADNVEQRVTQRVQQHYAPIEQEWQQQQRMAQMVPVIEKQIAEARTWPNFTELEPQIVNALKADPNISLERAYLKVYQDQVVPKLTTDRNKIRTELLAELKQKPVASSAPSAQVRPQTKPSNEPRSLDQVIKDALKEQGIDFHDDPY